MTSAVLMLDFDGVLNDLDWRRNSVKDHPGFGWSFDLGLAMLDPVRCARVQRICDTTGAHLLLVTGWRQFAGEEVLTRLLRDRGVTAPVAGVVGGVKMSGDLRAWASREWLKAHPEVTRHVVLDDTESYWRDWRGPVIRPIDGLEDTHVAEIITALTPRA